MHPLVARIHPSFRTAVAAWFVTRALLWTSAAATGRGVFAELDATGAPAWSALAHVALGLEAAVGHWGPFGAGSVVLAVIAEAALLVACVGIYRFVRRDQLPQTAARATWLWAACPAMVWTLPAGDWAFAAAMVAMSLWALSSSRHLLAAALLVGAMAFKLEAMLVWPAVALLGWKNYQAGKQHPASPWLTALGPPAAFTGLVVVATGLAGRFGVSLRGLQSGAAWRESLAWQGLSAHAPDIFLVSLLACGLVLALIYLKQCPRTWPLMALPCLAWPLLHQPPTAAAAAILFGAPFFAYLARATDEPGLQRALLAAFLGGLLLLG